MSSSPFLGVVYSGMGPDYRVLVRKGRKKAQQYFSTYYEPIPTLQLTREVASIMQEYTQVLCDLPIWVLFSFLFLSFVWLSPFYIIIQTIVCF